MNTVKAISIFGTIALVVGAGVIGRIQGEHSIKQNFRREMAIARAESARIVQEQEERTKHSTIQCESLFAEKFDEFESEMAEFTYLDEYSDYMERYERSTGYLANYCVKGLFSLEEIASKIEAVSERNIKRIQRAERASYQK